MKKRTFYRFICETKLDKQFYKNFGQTLYKQKKIKEKKIDR